MAKEHVESCKASGILVIFIEQIKMWRNIMNQHTIVIKSYKDYKTQFGDKYCHKKDIKHEFYGDVFVFYFEDCFSDLDVSIGFSQIEKRYRNTVCIQSIIVIKHEKLVKIRIQHANDYAAFYINFVDTFDNIYKIKKEYLGFVFCFEIYYSFENKINEFLIHNYLLLQYKFLNSSEYFKLYIYGSDNANEKSDIARITTYVADCESMIRNSIFFNGHPLFDKKMNVGKLFPAMFIDEETFRFLRDPIDPDVWDRIVKSEKIGPDSFKHSKNTQQYTKHWFIFQACKKYLFTEYDGNQSNKHTKLQNIVFGSEKFKNHILRMPLLALILFAQFDCFYRNSMLKNFKEKTGRNQLNWSDFILDIQEQQDFCSYKMYKEMCGFDENIKSLIKFKKFDKGNVISNFYEENIVIHEAVVSELFESATIAEGLLQLMENAVEYAQGGLLSIRIRENKDQDQEYLKKGYVEYFQDSESWKNVKFFLEVKLSDVSDTNLKETFLNNIKSRCDKNRDMQSWYEQYEKIFNGCSGVFLPFFEPKTELALAWNDYYEISGNQVHHFGLQIFDSIITTKNGLLHISGHGDEYAKNKCQIDSDINIKGTSYRILLPINQRYKSNKNIIVDTACENITEFQVLNKYMSEGVYNICVPDWNQIIGWVNGYKSGEVDKESAVCGIFESLKNTCNNNKYLLLIDYNSLDNTANYAVELLLKGILIFLLSPFNIPVSIINLHSHALLEASRIVALFYGKNGVAISKMEKIQIYMNGNEVGEEILFVGNNLNQNADRLRRIAMTRGIMFEYWQVAQTLMQRTE